MFKAKGEFSKRQVVYRAIRDAKTGDLIPYDALPYAREQLPAREDVSKLFEREQNRHVVCIRDEGWKIVSGSDQVEAAIRTRRGATRKFGRSLQIIETTDRREMSGEDRLRADAELINTRTGYGVLRGLAVTRLGVDDVKRLGPEHGL